MKFLTAHCLRIFLESAESVQPGSFSIWALASAGETASTPPSHGLHLRFTSSDSVSVGMATPKYKEVKIGRHCKQRADVHEAAGVGARPNSAAIGCSASITN